MFFIHIDLNLYDIVPLDYLPSLQIKLNCASLSLSGIVPVYTGLEQIDLLVLDLHKQSSVLTVGGIVIV